MPSIHLESEKSLRILEALAIYKYLTISQMTMMGLGGEKKYKTYLNTLLKKMRERKRPTIACIKFAGTHKFQQREYVYYLTKYGVNDLILSSGLDKDEINYPIGTSSMYERDYSHRKCFIDTKIKLFEWAALQQIQVSFFESYYDYHGNSRSGTLRSKTSVQLSGQTSKRIIPDGIFALQVGNKMKLFALEIHLGRDTKRAMRQIANHIISLQSGSISIHYNLKIGNRVLYVFDNKNIMKSVISNFLKSKSIPNAYNDYFLFAYYEDILQNFENWMDCTLKKVPLV